MSMAAFDDEAKVLKELGRRIKHQRIRSGITQAQMAKKCGFALSTVIRIESGEDSKVSNLLKIISALDLTENLDMLIPDDEIDYKAAYEKRSMRKRVRGKTKKTTSQWRWGEDG